MERREIQESKDMRDIQILLEEFGDRLLASSVEVSDNQIMILMDSLRTHMFSAISEYVGVIIRDDRLNSVETRINTSLLGYSATETRTKSIDMRNNAEIIEFMKELVFKLRRILVNSGLSGEMISTTLVSKRNALTHARTVN